MLTGRATGRHRSNGAPKGTVLHAIETVLALTIVLAEAPNALASNHREDLASYEGVWIGDSVIAEQRAEGPVVGAHNAGVAIRETETGFEMTWNSLGQRQAAVTRAQFVASGEADVFTVESVEPPLTGNEKLWAQMEDGRLVVYLTVLGNERTESLSRCAFAVSGGQMAFDCTLSRGNEVLERTKGRLSRAKIVL